MSRIALYVFSGTGNTRKIAELYRSEFESSGHVCAIVDVTVAAAAAPNPNEFDLCGFGYPVHAFNPPKIFLDFCRALPSVGALPAFVFKTSGEPLSLNDSSSQKLISVLKKRGFVVRHERHFLMPYNILFRHRDEMAKQMYVYARALAKAYAQDALSPVCESTAVGRGKRLNSVLFRIEWGFARLNGRFFRAKRKRCIDCGKCARECPLGNIKIDESGKIRFGKSCALCMRCAFCCPADAVSIGLLNFWRVNGEYQFDALLADPTLPFPFIRPETKSGYRVYRAYYRRADETLAEHGMPPVSPDPNAEFNL